MSAETTARQPGNMRPNAIGGTITANPSRSTTCPICTKQRPKNRKWSTYCSDKCRRAAWRIRKGEESSPSVVERLNRIEKKLDQLLAGAK